MTSRALLTGILLTVSAASVVAAGALWVAWDDLRGRHEQASADLEQARGIAREVDRLGRAQESMRTTLDGVCELMLKQRDEEGDGAAALEAFKLNLDRREKQTKELAAKLEGAETRAEQLAGQLTTRQAELNKTSVDLTRTQNDLKKKTDEAGVLVKQLEASRADALGKKEQIDGLNGQLAAVIAERGKLVAERDGLAAKKTDLEKTVKTLTDAQSEQNTAVVALQDQVDKKDKELAALKTQLDALQKKASETEAALKTQLDAVTKTSASTAASLKAAQDQVTQLQQQITQLQAQMKTLQEQLEAMKKKPEPAAQ